MSDYWYTNYHICPFGVNWHLIILLNYQYVFRSLKKYLLESWCEMYLDQVAHTQCACHDRVKTCWWSWRMTRWTWSTPWVRIYFIFSRLAAFVFGVLAETMEGRYLKHFEFVSFYFLSSFKLKLLQKCLFNNGFSFYIILIALLL